MARIRSIKPEFFLHERLSELPPMARLLFIGLWTLADKVGRLEDRPRRIKASVFPYEEVEIEPLLVALNKGGHIQRYEVDGDSFIAIPAWTKHQRPHPKETGADIPEPPKPEKNTASREKTRQEIKLHPCIPSSPGGREGKELLVSGNGEPAGPGPFVQPPSAAAASVGRPVLRHQLEAAFLAARGSPYSWLTADDNAMGPVLARAGFNDSEILRRWQIGLATKFPRCDSVRHLVDHWNSYATDQPCKPASSAPKAPDPVFFHPDGRKKTVDELYPDFEPGGGVR